MKRALLTLCLAWAAPAHADTSLPSPAGAGSWGDRCAKRLDRAATTVQLTASPAQASVLPLVREDGSPNPIQRVDLAAEEGVWISTGTDSEALADKAWTQTLTLIASKPRNSYDTTWFRRSNHVWAKLFLHHAAPVRQREVRVLREALDDCLKMGDPK